MHRAVRREKVSRPSHVLTGLLALRLLGFRRAVTVCVGSLYVQ